LESILHPLVKQAGEHFLQHAIAEGRQAIVQDIPLLYETGADKDCHTVIVVSVPEEIQKARVLQRDGMDDSKLSAIKNLQMPDAEKIARAHFVIDGTQPKPIIMDKVAEILYSLSGKKTN
jgi:dephospho-CoA kinase